VHAAVLCKSSRFWIAPFSPNEIVCTVLSSFLCRLHCVGSVDLQLARVPGTASMYVAGATLLFTCASLGGLVVICVVIDVGEFVTICEVMSIVSFSDKSPCLDSTLLHNSRASAGLIPQRVATSATESGRLRIGLFPLLNPP